ncbi:MAG TPA: AAA family ATPase [Leptolyngbyaceae cyanobacterium M65_K2018_010]|nr:AAA family ATPase [Leptolyngbyaceae cyanobacterium M65_K2018_010]
MEFDQAIATASATLQVHGHRPLTDLEIDLLRGAWEQLTYEQIAEASGYSLNYLQRDFGPKFWRRLSQVYGCKVNKVNARAVLTRKAEEPRMRALETDRVLSPPSPLPSPPHLVGRQPEWEALCQWGEGLWQPQAVDTARPVMVLTGEPGMGKTRLLEELSALAQGHQAQVLWGSGFAAERMRPYGIWVDALRSASLEVMADWPAELGFLLPELGQPSQTLPDPSHLFDAVVQLLTGLAQRSPLLLVLDDLQWLDEASSALLHYAVRVLRPLPIWVAGSARQGELAANRAVADGLRSLRREQRLHTLELQPLTAAQIGDLLAQAKNSPPAICSTPEVEQVFTASGGNPLLALEIARSQGQTQGGAASLLEALIRDRLEQLAPPTRELLPWLAALGRSFQPATVAQVTDCSTGQLLGAIEQLEQQSMIRPSTLRLRVDRPSLDSYDFAHGIIRQVVYQQIAAPRRQLIHRQIAQRLHQQAPQDETLASDIAYHASLGGDHALAAAAAVMAAEHSLKLFAYGEALHQAQRGLAHCQHLDRPTGLLVQTQLLRVCALAGCSGAAAAPLEAKAQQLMQEAKRLGLTEAEAGALEILLILQFEGNNYRKVHQHSLRAAEVGRLASPLTTARMLAYSGSCLAEIGRDMPRAEALLLEAQSLANRAGIEPCDIASGLGCVHRHYGRYDQARQYLQQAWRLAQAQQDHWREASCLSYLAMTELEAGSPAAALPYGREIAAVGAHMSEESSTAATAQALAALAHYHLQTPKAAADLDQGIAALQQADAKRTLAYLLRSAAEVDLSRDRPDLALRRAELALEQAQTLNHPSEIAHSWAVVVQSAIAAGNLNRARDEFDAFYPRLSLYDLSLPAQIAVTQTIDQIRPYQPAWYATPPTSQFIQPDP